MVDFREGAELGALQWVLPPALFFLSWQVSGGLKHEQLLGCISLLLLGTAVCR